MTRETALQVNRLLLRIDDQDLEDELVAVVQARLDKVLKELEKL